MLCTMPYTPTCSHLAIGAVPDSALGLEMRVTGQGDGQLLQGGLATGDEDDDVGSTVVHGVTAGLGAALKHL